MAASPYNRVRMKRGTYVRVIPLRLSTKLIVDFPDGKPKPRSRRPFLFGHWIEGYLLEDLIPGSRIWFDRRHLRDGKLIEDTWSSSPVVCIVADQVVCDRATFQILLVPPFDFTELHHKT